MKGGKSGKKEEGKDHVYQTWVEGWDYQAEETTHSWGVSRVPVNEEDRKVSKN